MAKTVVNNKSAAGLRRSAIAEQLRLREEWSSLKGTDDGNEPPIKVKKKQTEALNRNMHNIKGVYRIATQNREKINAGSTEDKENSQPTSDALRGVVALVDVGAEPRALALRAALTALGASVMPAWSPLVTHLVWSQEGCRDTRARARALACKVVSPLWVEACAASARRVSERVFPSTTRASDLPSPATLYRLLKRAEKENWVLSQLGSDSEDDGRRPRLRISSDTDEARERTGGETSRESVDVESRVNTAPRRALPVSLSPPPAEPRSRRKLFTARAEGEDDSDAENTPALIAKSKTRPGKPPTVSERQKNVKHLTAEQRKNLEDAKRMARQLAKPATEKRDEATRTQRRVGEIQTQQRPGRTQTQRRKRSIMPRIVLSGMPKSQYQAVLAAVETLKGKVQKHVNHRTTHVLLGTCREDRNRNSRNANDNNKQRDRERSPKELLAYCNHCNSPEGLLARLFEEDNVYVSNHCTHQSSHENNVTIVCGKGNCKRNRDNVVTVNGDKRMSEVNKCDISVVCDGIINDKRLRTLKTLLGAARGCRVLHAQWALDSLKEKKWQPHIGYEVTHLLKISQKARVERSAIDKKDLEYGYNVFRGMQVCVSDTAVQRDAAAQLLTLCGAELVDEATARDYNRNIQRTANQQPISKSTQNVGRTQNGGLTQNGGKVSENCEIVIVGTAGDEVSSKWVFDSVAAARPRTIRRYINKNIVTVHL